MKFLFNLVLIFIVSLIPLSAQTDNVVALPSSPDTGQTVRLIALEEYYHHWNKSGGVWCATTVCQWYNESADIEQFQEMVWKSDTAGTFTITITGDFVEAVTLTITVTDPEP